MKAILLCAGYATRLYPLTEKTPKPLLPVGGKPILEHILEKVFKIPGVTEAVIVTNSKFFPHFQEWKKGKPWRLTILNDGTHSNEDRKGALGDLQFALDSLKIADDCLVIAGDNLFSFSLQSMVDCSKQKRAAVVTLYDVQELELAKLYGIVKIDTSGKIIDFHEKPEHPTSTLSSTGVYLYPHASLAKLKTFLAEGGKHDKSGDFLEWLYTREPVYGLVTTERWYDIGSLEQLEEARRAFP
ncbi:MAG: nucleotidyltransferase family protein [Nanoarchaeota archaeon]|nr:nucleotidyltransferase family protein [Nanoarchaeota archaeon]